MMAIDYEAQFSELNPDGFKIVDGMKEWRLRRIFGNPRSAFRWAQAREDAGIGVAFARCGKTYYVWSE